MFSVFSRPYFEVSDSANRALRAASYPRKKTRVRMLLAILQAEEVKFDAILSVSAFPPSVEYIGFECVFLSDHLRCAVR